MERSLEQVVGLRQQDRGMSWSAHGSLVGLGAFGCHDRVGCLPFCQVRMSNPDNERAQVVQNRFFSPEIKFA
jgi:hypothetical protein